MKGSNLFVNEVIAAEGSIFLFIDEIHTLIGAGKTRGGYGCCQHPQTTLARWTEGPLNLPQLWMNIKSILRKDKTLERRFQIVMADERREEDAISILRGLKKGTETHHKISITERSSGSCGSIVESLHYRSFYPIRPSTSSMKLLQVASGNEFHAGRTGWNKSEKDPTVGNEEREAMKRRRQDQTWKNQFGQFGRTAQWVKAKMGKWSVMWCQGTGLPKRGEN